MEKESFALRVLSFLKVLLSSYGCPSTLTQQEEIPSLICVYMLYTIETKLTTKYVPCIVCLCWLKNYYILSSIPPFTRPLLLLGLQCNIIINPPCSVFQHFIHIPKKLMYLTISFVNAPYFISVFFFILLFGFANATTARAHSVRGFKRHSIQTKRLSGRLCLTSQGSGNSFSLTDFV